MLLSNCACGTAVEIEAGEQGGQVITCRGCGDIMITLSSDEESFASEWNQRCIDRANVELELIGRIRELLK